LQGIFQHGGALTIEWLYRRVFETFKSDLIRKGQN